MKRNNVITLILAIFTSLAIALMLFIIFNYDLSKDFIKSFSFAPTSEITKLQDNLELTYRGELVFKASSPQLESEIAFNTHCKSYNPGVSVLGCYADDVIYIYNINSEDLSGAIESTAAHEILHAVWNRLSKSEKENLIPTLGQVYEENRSKLAAIEDYEESERDDEIFARAGTEIENLPTNLEETYSVYFKNRKKIVDYYNKYYEVFEKLSGNIKKIVSRIDELKISIDKKTEDYVSRSEKLKKDVEEFNKCADKMGCFSSSDFINKRSELQTEQGALEKLHNEISAEVEEYNQKVLEYNNNALKIEQYTSIINSNIKQE